MDPSMEEELLENWIKELEQGMAEMSTVIGNQSSSVSSIYNTFTTWDLCQADGWMYIVAFAFVSWNFQKAHLDTTYMYLQSLKNYPK